MMKNMMTMKHKSNLKKWALNLETLTLIQVVKFEYKTGYMYFEAETWKEADKFVCALIKGKIQPIPPPHEICKIIEEIIKN